MTKENKKSSAGADDSQNDSKDSHVEGKKKNQKDGSLSSEERKELEELRQKQEIKKNIELLDEEYNRKAKRNAKKVSGNNTQDATEMESFLADERNGALEDFFETHKEYRDTAKRDELLAEVKSFRGTKKAGYRGYAQLLQKAHKILGGDSSDRNKKKNKVKSFNEQIAGTGPTGSQRDFGDKTVLTPEQKRAAKKTGVSEKQYIEQLKQTNITGL